MPKKVIGRLETKGPGLSDRQIRGIASTESVDRDNEILSIPGATLPPDGHVPILRGHDPDKAVGNGLMTKIGNVLSVLITFPAAGISKIADETLGLVRAGCMTGLSVGFLPRDFVMVNGKRKWTSWDLLECSIVAIPSNPDAKIIERTFRGGSSALTKAQRQAEIAALREIGMKHRYAVEPQFATNDAEFCARANKQEVAELQRRASILREAYSPGPSRAQRIDEIAKLRRR